MPTIDAQGNVHGDHDGQFQNKHQAAAGYDLTPVAMSAEPEKPKRRGRGPTMNQETALSAILAVGHEGCTYEDFEWNGTMEPFTVNCTQHGPYTTTANTHLYRKQKGCGSCGQNNKRYTTDSYLAALRDRYEGIDDALDLDEVDYVNAKTKLKIICRTPGHPSFEVFPSVFLTKQTRCAECVRDEIRLTFDEIVKRAQTRPEHEGKYTYPPQDIRGTSAHMLVVCRKHGEFTIKVHSHIAGGRGCSDCAHESRARQTRERQTFTLAEWVEKAIGRHGVRYDYSLVDYQGSTQKVTIVCGKHGPFDQEANSHLRGAGCPDCPESRGEAAVRLILESEGIQFHTQWRDHNCAHKYVLAFDFALPEQRILIEFDGVQHHRPVKWHLSMTDEEAAAAFHEVLVRDKIKNEWAAANGWRLIRIAGLGSIHKSLADHGVLPSIDDQAVA